jgi:hypothetical protein
LDILYAEILNNSSKENLLVSDSKTIQNDKLTIGSGSTSKNTNESNAKSSSKINEFSMTLRSQKSKLSKSIHSDD